MTLSPTARPVHTRRRQASGRATSLQQREKCPRSGECCQTARLRGSRGCHRRLRRARRSSRPVGRRRPWCWCRMAAPRCASGRCRCRACDDANPIPYTERQKLHDHMNRYGDASHLDYTPSAPAGCSHAPLGPSERVEWLRGHQHSRRRHQRSWHAESLLKVFSPPSSKSMQCKTGGSTLKSKRTQDPLPVPLDVDPRANCCRQNDEAEARS